MFANKKNSLKQKRALAAMESFKLKQPSNNGDATEDTTTSGDDSGPIDKVQGREAWRTKMTKTFEALLLRLDELYMDLRTEEKFCANHKQTSAFSAYQSICEKLRMEILIAIDKTELVTSTNPGHNSQREQDLLRKCEMLKSHLSNIRWQYHNAMREYNLHV